jgi:hypothetical protein
MNTLRELITLGLVLVGIYLLVNNWKGTTEIIKTAGGQLSSNFKVLQARG